jgi:DNA-binding MarR family transcriptional regulator
MDQTLKSPPPLDAPSVDLHRQLLLDRNLSPDAAQAAIDIDAEMANMRRSMARKDFGRMALRELKLEIDMTDLEVISMIECGPGADGQITVGLIAERLAVDPSRASRIVADAVDKGIVRRVASQSDARRIGLELTDEGRSHADAIRQFKWNTFAQAFDNWSDEDLVTFAKLFKRYSMTMSEIKSSKAEQA